MSKLVSINKKIVKPEEALISIFDHGFLFGDSVYETVKTFNKIPFGLKEHLNRLKRSADLIRMSLPYSLNEIAQEIIRVIKAAEHEESKVRIIVTRGEGEVDIHPESCPAPLLIIIGMPFEGYPPEYFTEGVRISIVGVRRNPKDATNPKIKSGNYLNSILAIMEAREKGSLEGIMLNSSGNITEASTSNIFFIKNDKLITSNLDSGILDGITRSFVISVAQNNGIDFEEREIPFEELKDMQEAFLTSSLKDIMPIKEIIHKDGIISLKSPGKNTLKLRKIFDLEIEKFCQKYGSLDNFEKEIF